MVFRVDPEEKSLRKGPWLEEEDERLITFVTLLGERRWDALARVSGLKRSGKSCRLRWLNYLHPNLKHGRISKDEERIILRLHALWGNKWSKIARRLPGRTDNEIKNYFRTHLRKRAQVQERDVRIRDEAKDDRQHQIDSADARPQNCSAGDTPRTEGHTSYDTRGSPNVANMCSSFACGVSDIANISSPYETRVSDWLSGYPAEQSAMQLYEDHGSTGSFLFKAGWSSEGSDACEFSWPLWT